jgi:hypothetical protein
MADKIIGEAPYAVLFARYHQHYQIKEDNMGVGETRNAYDILVGNLEGKRSLGQIKCIRK